MFIIRKRIFLILMYFFNNKRVSIYIDSYRLWLICIYLFIFMVVVFELKFKIRFGKEKFVFKFLYFCILNFFLRKIFKFYIKYLLFDIFISLW